MRNFRASEVVIAIATAAGAQATLYEVFSSTTPPRVLADVSDEGARPIAVAITPVSALPSAEHHPPGLPTAWQRHRTAVALPAPPTATVAPSVTAPSPPPPPDASAISPRPPPAAAASTQPPPAPATLPENPPASASLGPSVPPVAPKPETETRRRITSSRPPLGQPTEVLPEKSAPAIAGGEPVASGEAAASASATTGAPGVDHEGDGLKLRAIGFYRSSLVSWFMARFDIRGKIPFQTLKGLRAVVQVSVAPERTVRGYTLVSASGNLIFDAEVRTTLANIQASGATLPAPPPLYPEVLGATLSVSFECTLRSKCE